MEQKKIKTLLLAGVITLVGSSVVACTEDAESLPSPCNEFITFDKPEIKEASSLSTRTVGDANENSSVYIGSKILRSKKNEVMHLHVLEDDFFTQRGTEEKSITRGTLVTSEAGITNFGVSSSAYPASGTYTSYGLGSYFYKQQAVPNTAMTYYWPTADKEISFFAYFPYNNASFTVSSSAATLGSPVYHYTVPSTISNQVDVMTAQITDHTAGSQGALTLNFSHHCAAIKISITNNSGSSITVNSVSIEGVEYDGTLHDGTWTLSGNLNTSSVNPFSLSYGSAIANNATADITGSNNILIMLPQTLTSSAKLKVVTADDTYETAISGTWVAGKTYTYSVIKSANSIDLSMVDNAGNARASMTTANCYMVHDAGDYKIPLVYGNAIKNGNANSTSYAGVSGQLYPFVNHAGAGINGPWITKSTSGTGVNKGMGVTVNGAELLWQDASGLISAVGIDGDYLTFTVPAAASSKAGNALIAAKSGSTIVWSWHIWVTTETLASTTSIATGSHTYRVAPVNLGWIPTGGSGKQGYCTYYQWGRKDPFIPAASYSSTSNHTVYNISNSSVTGITYSGTGVTIADNIKNPTTHYYYSSNYGPVTTTYYNMWDAQNTATNNVTSATKKTIYDPCPPGFCVPTGNLYCYMGNGLSNPTSSTTRSDSNWDSTNKGKTWTLNGASIYFPAAGSRNYSSGSLSYVGSFGFYWSATPFSTYYGRCLNVYSSYWYWYNTSRAYGFSVRPVAEE